MRQYLVRTVFIDGTIQNGCFLYKKHKNSKVEYASTWYTEYPVQLYRLYDTTICQSGVFLLFHHGQFLYKLAAA
eukprot:SAG11_NODE_819_length_7017_cov_3.801821_6_plen_74_part_00